MKIVFSTVVFGSVVALLVSSHCDHDSSDDECVKSGTTGEDCSDLYNLTPQSMAISLMSGYNYLLDCYKELNEYTIMGNVNRLRGVFRLSKRKKSVEDKWISFYNYASNIQVEVVKVLSKKEEVVANMKMMFGEPHFGGYEYLIECINKAHDVGLLPRGSEVLHSETCKKFMEDVHHNNLSEIDQLKCAAEAQREMARILKKKPDILEKFMVDGFPKKLVLGNANRAALGLYYMHIRNMMSHKMTSTMMPYYNMTTMMPYYNMTTMMPNYNNTMIPF